MQTLINKEEYSKVIIIEITREKTKVKHIFKKLSPQQDPDRSYGNQ